jgi:UDP-glucose:(heptosyl)LPS alpha-1,3-glucosyltransferase
MAKKIALIIERVDIALGGAERSVSELADGLSALGNDVHILAAKGTASAGNVHILCPYNSAKRVSFAEFKNAMEKHLEQNHYDVIHSVLPFDFADVYQPRGGTYAETILRNAASYQNRIFEVWKKLTAFANTRRNVLLKAEQKLAANPNGPLIVAISQYVADQFKKHYGTSEERITIIPNGVKVDKAVDAAEADRLRSQILDKLNLTEAQKPVLFLLAANNFRLKGLAPLIRAIHLLSQDGKIKSSYFIIAGGGKTHKYHRLAAKLRVDKKFIFLGKVPHINNALSITGAAILPTFYDPSSRFILEALAAGKPVITTRFNGAADMFVDERHGKIIDTPEDIVALAGAIAHFSVPDNISKASKAIRDDNLREKVSISLAVQSLDDLYESICRKASLTGLERKRRK